MFNRNCSQVDPKRNDEKEGNMFDSFDSATREFDPEQFVEWEATGISDLEPANCVTLIGQDKYGLEVELSGFVSVERDLVEAEAFLAGLYPQL